MKKSKNGVPDRLVGHLADQWMAGLWDKLLDRLAGMKSKKDLKNILETLFSEDEKKMILRRLAVIALVRSGKSYKQIGEALWVSSQTISTIKKNFFRKGENYKSYRFFYGGPKQWSSIYIEKKKSFQDVMEEFLGFVGVFMEPFFVKGIGIKGDLDFHGRLKR